MLEWFFLRFLVRKVGAMVSEKGHQPGGYKVLTVALWFTGEISGWVLGSSASDKGATYALAVLGALFGAAVAYCIAGAQSDLRVAEPDAVVSRPGASVGASAVSDPLMLERSFGVISPGADDQSRTP
jgi:hypothetical protein